MKPTEINVKGVQKLLENLDPRKAPGPDGLGAAVLKHLASHLAPPLAAIMEASLRAGQVPDDWRHAKVVPIHKKSSKESPLNYRPISLTSISSKIFEHILATNIRTHLDKNDILTSRQHGFRRTYSCDSQLLTTIGELINNLDDKVQTDIVVLDFSKAFDVVPHSRLIRKVRAYGIANDTSNWIEAWLRNRSMRVCVNGALSETRPVTSGVPQGSVLGPLLFLIYINDLSNHVNHSELRLFADDSLVYRSIADHTDQILLQEDLSGMLEWSITNKLHFNTSKCESATIKPEALSTTYTLGNSQLAKVTSFKYLGLIVSTNLSFDKHIIATISKASRSLYMMMRGLKRSPRKVKELSYKTIVRATLEYASQIWTPSAKKMIDALERVNRKAFRWAHGYRKFDRISAAMKHQDWETLEERRAAKDSATLQKINDGTLKVTLPHLRNLHHHDTRLHSTRESMKTTTKQSFFFNRMIN